MPTDTPIATFVQQAARYVVAFVGGVVARVGGFVVYVVVKHRGEWMA